MGKRNALQRDAARNGSSSSSHAAAANGFEMPLSQPPPQDAHLQKALAEAAELSQQFEAGSTEQRLMAAAALAGLLAENPAQTAALLDTGLLQHLLPRVQDESILVAAEAVGAIRNAMALQPAACLAQLSAAGGLPLLLAFFQAQMSALPNVLKLGTQHNEALASFAAIEHCCHLLKYLSEYSEEAVAVITAHKLPLLLADCIRPSDFPHSLCQAAAQALVTLIEDNPAASQQFAESSEAVQHLRTLAAHGASFGPSQLLSVTVAAILFYLQPQSLSQGDTTLLFQSALAPLRHNAFGMMNSLAPVVALALHQRSSGGLLEEAKALADFEAILAAQQTALELLTNMTSAEIEATDDDANMADEEDEQGAASAQADQEGLTAAASAASAAASGAMNGDGAGTDQQPLPALLATEVYPVLPALFARSELFETACAQVGTAALALLEDVAAVQARAVAFVINSVVECARAIEPVALESVISAILGVLDHAPPGSEAALVHDAGLALWASLRAAVAHGAAKSTVTIPEAQLQQICAQALTADDEQMRSLCVSLVGSVAQLAQHQKHLTELAKVLLHGATKDLSLRVKAEAIHGLIDAYAESNVNEAIAALNFMDTLRQSLPALKATKSAKVPVDYRLRLHEARINLPRFLEYKQAQFA